MREIEWKAGLKGRQDVPEILSGTSAEVRS